MDVTLLWIIYLLLPVYLGYIISLANKSGSELATCIFVVVFLDRCDSTAKLKAQLNGLKSLTRDSATFKKIYRYAFDFCRVSLRFFFLSGVDLLRCCWSTCQHFAIFIGKYLLRKSVNKKSHWIWTLAVNEVIISLMGTLELLQLLWLTSAQFLLTVLFVN